MTNCFNYMADLSCYTLLDSYWLWGLVERYCMCEPVRSLHARLNWILVENKSPKKINLLFGKKIGTEANLIFNIR